MFGCGGVGFCCFLFGLFFGDAWVSVSLIFSYVGMDNLNKRIDDRQSFKRARHRQKKKKHPRSTLARRQKWPFLPSCLWVHPYRVGDLRYDADEPTGLGRRNVTVLARNIRPERPKSQCAHHAQDPLNIDPIYRHGAEKYHVFGPYYALTPLEIK